MLDRVCDVAHPQTNHNKKRRSTMYFNRNQIELNPCRDTNKFKLVEASVLDKIPSIKKTGWWGSTLLRFKDNTLDGRTHDEMLEYVKAYEHENEYADPDHIFQLAYGTHRLAAIDRMFERGETFEDVPGIELIDGELWIKMQLSAIEDPSMLRIMANENKDNAERATSGLVESVLQAEEFLIGELRKIKEIGFDAYTGGYFDSEDSFKQIAKEYEENGELGARTIHRFLGEQFKLSEIRYIVAGVKAYRSGNLELDDINEIPNISLMGEYVTFCNNLMSETVKKGKKDVDNVAKDWPESIKRFFIKNMADLILGRGQFLPKCDDERKKKLIEARGLAGDFVTVMQSGQRPTVRTMRTAASVFGNPVKDMPGVVKDPLLAARTGGKSQNMSPAILLYNWLELDPSRTVEGSIADVKALVERFGLNGDEECLETVADMVLASWEKLQRDNEKEANKEGDDLQGAVDAGDEEAPGLDGSVPPVAPEDVEVAAAETATNMTVLAGRIAALTAVIGQETITPELRAAANKLAAAVLSLQDKFTDED
jgi:hypothetical protein